MRNENETKTKRKRNKPGKNWQRRGKRQNETETETEEKDEAKTTDKEKEEANKSSMNTKCENPQRLMFFSLAPAEPTAAKTTEQEHQEETNRHKAGSKQTTQ